MSLVWIWPVKGEVAKSEAELGSGERFQRLMEKLKRQGVQDPAALAAAIGRKKYGKKRMAKLSREERDA